MSIKQWLDKGKLALHIHVWELVKPTEKQYHIIFRKLGGTGHKPGAECQGLHVFFLCELWKKEDMRTDEGYEENRTGYMKGQKVWLWLNYILCIYENVTIKCMIFFLQSVYPNKMLWKRGTNIHKDTSVTHFRKFEYILGNDDSHLKAM